MKNPVIWKGEMSMGLIRAGIGAMGGTLADQWKEFFYCDSMGKDVLVTKGQKRTSGRSSNTKGNDNIISNGSGIAVADGQCMLIVEQGKIVEFCAESGEFTYDTSTEPVFSAVIWETALRRPSRLLENVSHMVAIQERIREFITLTQKKWARSFMVQQHQFHSA